MQCKQSYVTLAITLTLTRAHTQTHTFDDINKKNDKLHTTTKKPWLKKEEEDDDCTTSTNVPNSDLWEVKELHTEAHYGITSSPTPEAKLHGSKLEEFPLEGSSCCLVRTHEQPNAYSNAQAHPQAYTNTDPHTSIEPWELAVIICVHIFWIEVTPEFPFWIVSINIPFWNLQNTKKEERHKITDLMWCTTHCIRQMQMTNWIFLTKDHKWRGKKERKKKEELQIGEILNN